MTTSNEDRKQYFGFTADTRYIVSIAEVKTLNGIRLRSAVYGVNCYDSAVLLWLDLEERPEVDYMPDEMAEMLAHHIWRRFRAMGFAAGDAEVKA